MRMVLKKVCLFLFILTLLKENKEQKQGHLLVYGKRSSLGYIKGPS